MHVNTPDICVQILNELLVAAQWKLNTAQLNLAAANENLTFCKENAILCLNNAMNDVASANQCITTLEALEGALVLVVANLGQVAVAAVFWEYSPYANFAFSEFMVAQELLPGTILENVTNPKAKVEEYIADVASEQKASYDAEVELASAALLAAATTFEENAAILKETRGNATAASKYGTTKEANKFIALLTDLGYGGIRKCRAKGGLCV